MVPLRIRSGNRSVPPTDWNTDVALKSAMTARVTSVLRSSSSESVLVWEKLRTVACSLSSSGEASRKGCTRTLAGMVTGLSSRKRVGLYATHAERSTAPQPVTTQREAVRMVVAFRFPLRVYRDAARKATGFPGPRSTGSLSEFGNRSQDFRG